MSMATDQVFHVGDRAWFVFRGHEVEVEVIEERGPLGIGGRHLVRVRVLREVDEPYETTVPEVELRPRTGAA